MAQGRFASAWSGVALIDGGNLDHLPRCLVHGIGQGASSLVVVHPPSVSCCTSGLL
jgi:hypothetical protein